MISGSAPRTVAWFHCFSGIAGDMALGALIDAGADPAAVEEGLRRLPVDGWSLSVTRVLRGGIECSRIAVTVRDDHHDRRAAGIVALVDQAGLPARVTERARAIFRRLAEVEGRLHGQPPDTVHFHEVGGQDALVDVVGTALALELLGVDEVCASPVAVGTGMVHAAHGPLPNPPPAVVRLLEGAPVAGHPTPRELTTPTGAAILAALATSYGPLPAMTVRASGFGAGHADPDDLPNCTQVVIGTQPVGDDDPGGGQSLMELQANLDDATGEDLAYALAALLDAGARDAWSVPVVMKKGRPGHVVHALADPATVPSLRALMRRSTGSFGVRALPVTRWPVHRRMATVMVAGAPVRMKVGPDRAKAELDDLAAIARRTGQPLAELRSLAEEAWRQSNQGAGDD